MISFAKSDSAGITFNLFAFENSSKELCLYYNNLSELRKLILQVVWKCILC